MDDLAGPYGGVVGLVVGVVVVSLPLMERPKPERPAGKAATAAPGCEVR